MSKSLSSFEVVLYRLSADGETPGHDDDDDDGDDDCASSSEQSTEQVLAQQPEQPASEPSLLQTPEHHAMLLSHHPPEQHQSLHTDAELSAQLTPGEQLACSSAAHAYFTALDRMKTASLVSRNASLDMVEGERSSCVMRFDSAI